MKDRHSPQAVLDMIEPYRMPNRPLVVDIDELRAIAHAISERCIFRVNGVPCEAGCPGLEFCGRDNDPR